MTMHDSVAPGQSEMVEGNICLLSVLDEYFMVRILNIRDDIVNVSFPGLDYPIKDMIVTMEFHTEQGFNQYQTYVVDGPGSGHKGILLKRPITPIRRMHRTTCRVETDLTVQVKDQVHLRWYDAVLVNLSVGGALIRSSAPFDFSTTVELNLSLPEETMRLLTAQVVHMAEASDPIRGGERIYGLQFIGIDPSASNMISVYVWNQLRNLYRV